MIWSCEYCYDKWEEIDKGGIRKKPTCPQCKSKLFVKSFDAIPKKDRKYYRWYE